MTATENIDQHLEMLIQKRNRCEDWVASVTLQENIRKPKGKRLRDIDEDYIDELSTETDDNESVKRRIRKTVNHQKMLLNLICEWRDCDFVCTNKRLNFLEHVTFHVKDVGIMEKSDKTECYQCLWENCNFNTLNDSEIKRHINYHAYHTILKAAAFELHNMWDFVPCRLDSENKNWLPDLSHPFKCHVIDCSFTTDYFNVFLDHVNSHINDLDFGLNKKKEMKCIWKGCTTFKCRNKTRMRIHIKSHTGEKTLACPTCGALFATNTKYMDHCSRKTPTKNESNRCQYCLRYFSNERLLRDHMRYHINSHKCSFCEITCSTPSVLANHVRYRHLNERPFKCKQCSYTAVKAEDFNAHLSTHDEEARFQCQMDDCNFSCRAIMTFKKHFRTVHLMEQGRLYCCHLCDKKYNRGPLLGKHLRKVHKLERPPGHSRFRYMEGIDGQFRLQVERYETLELNNAAAQTTSIDDCKQNFILKQEVPDKMSYQKITVFLNENEEDSSSGALIAIDEVDENGEVIRTSTVREKLIDIPANEVVLIDVNEQYTNNIVRYNKENYELNIQNDNQSSEQIITSEVKTIIDEDINNISTLNSTSDDVTHTLVIRKRKNKIKSNLSDANCIKNEIILSSAY